MPVALSDIQNDYSRRVERERRRREDELLILLLAFMGTARVRAISAAEDGFDVATAIRNVIVGNSNRPGVAPDIARTMARAHADGFRRVGLAAGVRSVSRSDAGPLAALIDLYIPQARAAALAMVDSLVRRVFGAIATRPQDVTIRKAITDAFDADGFSRTNASAIDLATERAVVAAHSNGSFAAITTRQDLNVTGIEHISIIDEGTTDICRERHNLRLPVDDPYWVRNVPSLHWRCRSTLRPIFGDFTPSESLPLTPPMAGFGMNPLPLFARRAA